MSDSNARDEVPTAAGPALPPDEPFAYIKTNPGLAVRSPVALTLMYSGLALYGAWLVFVGLTTYPRAGDRALLGLAAVGVVMCGIGGWFTYVGIRRWRWKREYERVMGRSPW